MVEAAIRSQLAARAAAKASPDVVAHELVSVPVAPVASNVTILSALDLSKTLKTKTNTRNCSSTAKAS